MSRRPAHRFIETVGAPRDPEGLYRAMVHHLEALAVKGYTEASCYNSERYIRDFIAWCESRGLSRPGQITDSILEAYQRSLHYYRQKNGAPLSSYSQRAKLSPLKTFFKWLARQGEIGANPASDLDLPRMLQRLPRHVLSIEEVERILTLPNIDSPLGLRDRAMMEVLYSTGMRRMELAHLELSDIDFGRGCVLIRLGKGKKDRLIPLGERAACWVRRYLDNARPGLAGNERELTLFLSRDGEPLNLAWLSCNVAAYVRRGAAPKHGGCHLFRHTMATLMLEGGADLRYIQAMLGHAQLSTTQIYTQVALHQLLAIHATTHPGANLANRQHAQPGDPAAVATLSAPLDAKANEEAASESPGQPLRRNIREFSMVKTNAQRQAKYRHRHLAAEGGDAERLNFLIALPAKRKLEHLAAYYGVTQRAMLEQVLQEAERALLDRLQAAGQSVGD